MRSLKGWITAAAIVLAGAAPVRADPVSDFYAGKTVTIYIGYSVGGGYDINARLIAKYFSAHMPGHPTVLAENMEGAASLRVANFLFVKAPKDGTVIGTFAPSLAVYPLLGFQGAMYEGNKFNWIGAPTNDVSICAAWATTGIKSVDDLKTREMTAGGTGPSDDSVQFVKVMNNVLGTKIRAVSGYPGGNDAQLAMERGEVQGRCGWSWSAVKAINSDWVRDKKINILLQLALKPTPDLPGVPFIMDLIKDEETRQLLQLILSRQAMNYPFAAPPGVSEERVAALRKAFGDTLRDPQFIEDATRARLTIQPVSGEEIQTLVTGLYKTPPEIAAKAGAMLR